MNALRSLFLLAAGLSVAWCGPMAPIPERALPQFRNMILCKMPKSRPIWQLADYGCYCGKGGSGSPVDDLDRCCQVHDNCYGEAEKLKQCNPYFKFYAYSCDEESKTVTCDENNNACEMFICECDRKATECFARSPYNPKYRHWPQERCQ
ncbi:acidic phospholipase A2 2-like [Limanda limanda]|uniref:acidic phospholipase A2 2-like n=1 Tax=Limanda limanda TaxID=27771 RepID=UPI0029C8F268|nr:acidic phospholipase A2 2-like [Limanda limanda]